MRQRTAVGVAQHHAVGAVDHGGLEHPHCVFGVRLEAVEEVLGVEEDADPLTLQERDGLADHGHTLVERGAQRLGDMEVPALAHDAGGGGTGLDERGQRGIDVDLPGRTPGGTEGHEFSGAQVELLRSPLEELGVLRIGLRIATLDPAHPEELELLGDAELVVDRERDALELGAVAQRRVEDLDRGWERREGVVS